MEQPLGRQLALTGKVVSERFDDYLSQRCASLPMWILLRQLENEDALSQRELAARMGIEAPTLVRHLDRMEAEGLVTRRRDDRDRRIVRVSLTDAGRCRHDELKHVAADLDARLRSLFSDRELAIVRRALDRIRDFMSTLDLDEGRASVAGR
jgi:MarR family transcriptional regulator, transcriptional regulator for hemolysin